MLEIEEGNAIHKIEEYYENHKIEEYYENEIRLKSNSMFDKKKYY